MSSADNLQEHQRGKMPAIHTKNESKMRTIIGIDPGKNGAIAWITDGKPCVEKMPDTLKDLWELIRDIERDTAYEHGVCVSYIEQVTPMPSFGSGPRRSMGATSAFAFGRGVGNLEMALTASGIPLMRVTPKKWQGAMQCLSGGDKNKTKARAQELFPSLKITHATADALLIAEYGRRMERGNS
jgi:hypothetical protein